MTTTTGAVKKEEEEESAAAAVSSSSLVMMNEDDIDNNDDVLQEEQEEVEEVEEEAEAADEEDFVWYFAIGSMCNPISISNRDITVLESYPAEVLRYKLEFFGPSGVAGAVAADDDDDATGDAASFHGVLHKMSFENKAKLDEIEMGYDAVQCTVQLYDGTKKENALIYVLNPEKLKEYYSGDTKQENKPPTERYITIIIEGCEHYGVQQDHIDHLKSLDYQPRKDPSDFETLAYDSSTVPMMTMADVEDADGKNGKPLYTTCNGKVLHHVGLPSMLAEKIQNFKNDKGIHSYEVWLNAMLYDPVFGVIKSQEDVSKLCAASIEDQIVTWSKHTLARPTNSNSKEEDVPGTFVVGLIDLPYKD